MPQQKREYIQALNKQKNNIIDDIKTKVTSEFATTAFTLSSLEDLSFFYSEIVFVLSKATLVDERWRRSWPAHSLGC